MRMSIKEFKQSMGIDTPESWLSYLEELTTDSVCPALCDEGCEVEPDGTCEHDHPSVLLALGLV